MLGAKKWSPSQGPHLGLLPSRSLVISTLFLHNPQMKGFDEASKANPRSGSCISTKAGLLRPSQIWDKNATIEYCKTLLSCYLSPMIFCSSLFVPTLFLSSSSARKDEAFFQSSASISISTLSFLLFNHPISRLPRTLPVKAFLFIADGIPATPGATVFGAAELSPPRRLSLDATSQGIRSASSSAWICWRSATSTEDTRAKY